MRFFIISVLISLFTSASFAVMMDSFTSSGVVKSFDKSNVTVLCQERIIQIPKAAVTEGKLQPGQTVKFALTGEQVSKIFFADKKPASIPGK